jgi:hypothetical protein
MNIHTNNNVGDPGLLESLIPVWGSGRESVNHFQQGNYVRGIFWGAMAVTDIFLVKAVVVGGVKLVGKAGTALLMREGESIAAREGVQTVQKIGSSANEMLLRMKGPWRPSGNTWRLIRNKRVKYNWKNIFWDARDFKTKVSPQYWRASKGANGNSLQHLWAMNKTKWVPEGFRNAGFNLLEVPASLNTWMGGRRSREWAFRAGVAYLMKDTLETSYAGGNYMGQRLLHENKNYSEANH